MGLRRTLWKLKQRIRVLEDRISALEAWGSVDAIGFRFEPLNEGEDDGDRDRTKESH